MKSNRRNIGSGIDSSHALRKAANRPRVPADAKFGNCRKCANIENFPFCMKHCNIFHTRRENRSVNNAGCKDLTPFEKWMNICLTPACIQYDFIKSFTSDIPTYRKAQIAPGLFVMVLAEIAIFGGIGVTLWGIGMVLAKIIRQFQRQQYYPQERARRQQLAMERRRIRKRYTTNREPTGEELLAQWAKVRKNPREMIRFGSMLCDIEAFVDNSLIRNQYGEIVGRRAGIRGWLAANCPELYVRYKTIMRYKSMSEKFRQACGLSDPYPAEILLDGENCDGNSMKAEMDGKEIERKAKRKDGDENTVRNTSGLQAKTGRNRKRKNNADGQTEATEINGIVAANGAGPRGSVTDAVDAVTRENAANRTRFVRERREKAKMILRKCGTTERGLLAAIGSMINPDTVPAEVERWERLRQGLPERDGILRHFTKAMA